MNPDIRWRQRFENFDRALGLLREALADGQENLSPLEQEGAAQRLEYTLELAWKCMKDYLEDSGVTISPATPRQVIKEAFVAKIITDGQTWIDMLNHRNLLSHTYDFAVFEEAIRATEDRYLPTLQALHEFLSKELQK
jgi:nucleotidyltransferase substrate binding protein (TIGR01987 family)